MKSIASLAVGAGFALVTLAMFVQGFLPAIVPESRSRQVSRAVRTDLGDVKWVRHDASGYTPLEAVGRAVYIREGCWYCHSQYVRPVTGEDLRWGPVSEAGEYAFDLPHLFSTRRIGPDLTRVGGKYGDDWHYAHHWDPRLVVPDSIMPSFKWLYDQLRVPVKKTDDGLALEPMAGLARWFTMKKGDRRLPLYPNAEGLVFVTPPAAGPWPIEGAPVIDLTGFKDAPPALAEVTLVRPSGEMVGLVAYLQKLGSNRGAWREVFEPQNVSLSAMSIPRSQDLLALGREVYRSRCVGCHGQQGDGNGPAATFLFPRPRDFTLGVFKFRTTPSGSLPTDGDVFRTVTRGVRWTAMPTWHELPDKERLAVVSFVKTFSGRFRDEQPEPPLAIGDPPRATAELIARGKDLYQKAKCFQCHGPGGKGDGPSADELKDDLGFPIRPADFTRGQFKGGSSARDVFRTMSLGLDGTPMPSFADSMSEEERWAISYHVLSLSAWVDPLTGRRLELPAGARAALNSSAIEAGHPRMAVDAGEPGRLAHEARGRPRVLYPGIRE
jgi:cytochrome c oxidase cbb3-type subunit 2